MRVLDLCAGSKSATKAFLDRGHEVDTLDITGSHTYVCDVRFFFLEKKYDFIWASPPCTEFSIANSRLGRCKDRTPDMSIVEACIRICQIAPYWILENPRGCLRHFIGMPHVTLNYGDFGYEYLKPTDFWGVFPRFFNQTPRKIQTSLQHDGNGRKNRACVPYGLSLAICLAIEHDVLQ